MQATFIVETFHIRKANLGDVSHLDSMIARSLRVLGAQDYSSSQLDQLIRFVRGVDTELIKDGGLYVAVLGEVLVGCAAWSRRKATYGESEAAAFLDPRTDAAKIRNVFVDPHAARRGIGRRLMNQCESEAAAAGFEYTELLATLTGAKFYETLGYETIRQTSLDIGEGVSVAAVEMRKCLPGSALCA